jgi:hypothetical protein
MLSHITQSCVIAVGSMLNSLFQIFNATFHASLILLVQENEYFFRAKSKDNSI